MRSRWGHNYLKRCFEIPDVFEELSETRPYTDEEQVKYEKRYMEMEDVYRI